MRKNGYVTKKEVKSAIKDFVDEAKSEDKIKLLTFVFMGHGSENDWSARTRMVFFDQLFLGFIFPITKAQAC